MATRYTDDSAANRYGGGLSVPPALLTKHIFLKVDDIKLGSPAPTQAVIGNFSVLQFDGNTILDEVFAKFHVPEDYESGTDMSLHIHWSPTDTNTGGVIWNIKYASIEPEFDELLSSVGTSLSVRDLAQETADELLESDAMTIVAANITADDCMGIKIWRDPTDGDDTYESPASLIEIGIDYTARQSG